MHKKKDFYAHFSPVLHKDAHVCLRICLHIKRLDGACPPEVMPTTKFYLDTRRKDSLDRSIIKIAVSHNRKVFYIPLDIKLAVSQWDPIKERIINHPDAFILNNQIYARKQEIDSIIIRLMDGSSLKRMSAYDIKKHIDRSLNPDDYKEERDENLFVNRLLSFIENKKESTKETYMHTLSRIKAFIPSDYATLKFEDITVDWLDNFNAFMAKTSPSQNARNIHFRNIRAVFNNALDNEITKHYPFRRFKLKSVPTAKRSFTVEELRRLFFFPCQEHQIKYLDMFKLMFYLMGVNMIDLAKLTEMRNGRLDFNREKTGHLYSMKVEPEAMALFNRYKGKTHLLFILDNWTNDEFFRRKMNKELQKIGPMHKKPGRGGKKEYEPLFPQVTAYWARHSWATIADELDIPEKVIAEALGHEYGNPVTNIYIRKTLKKVDAANRKVLDWVLYGKIDDRVVVIPGTPEFFGLSKDEAVRLGLCKQSDMNLDAFRIGIVPKLKP